MFPCIQGTVMVSVFNFALQTLLSSVSEVSDPDGMMRLSTLKSDDGRRSNNILRRLIKHTAGRYSNTEEWAQSERNQPPHNHHTHQGHSKGKIGRRHHTHKPGQYWYSPKLSVCPSPPAKIFHYLIPFQIIDFYYNTRKEAEKDQRKLWQLPSPFFDSFLYRIFFDSQIRY